jgi:UDP-glucuronate decarboxylase
MGTRKELSIKGKKVLVTGGAGFLGSHLVEKLDGNDIVVVDDLSTTPEVVLPPWVTFHKKKAEEFTTTNGFDIIIHMAARPSPEDYIHFPVETMLANSIATYKMLEIARSNDAQFFYTSTSEVYGSAEKVPTPETYWGIVNPNGIRSCYDESKRFSEALAMSYHRQYGMDVRIERIFNTYGPRLRGEGSYGRVVSRFILQALQGQEITVHGDGQQTRAFLYVDDWTDATLRLLASNNLSGEVVNVGSDQEVTILDLAQQIVRLAGSQSKIIFSPPRIDDPRRRAADISKARRLLGWSPQIPLDEGLKRTIDWFKERI